MPELNNAQDAKTEPARRKWNRFPGPRRARSKDDGMEKSKSQLSQEAADAVAEFMQRKGSVTKCPTAFAFGVKEPQLNPV